uniref:Uncharacterized protein n=1 Tax=Pristionchus pacificus TaxID=54126 RepID=A0A2A6C7Q3_PRIPA|eukprot:PDM74137.1 hypothetical protein PRIPAC_41493 [Pristionchus pacificus]
MEGYGRGTLDARTLTADAPCDHLRNTGALPMQPNLADVICKKKYDCDCSIRSAASSAPNFCPAQSNTVIEWRGRGLPGSWNGADDRLLTCPGWNFLLCVTEHLRRILSFWRPIASVN